MWKKNLRRFIGKLLISLLTIFLVATFNFFLIRFMPGDPLEHLVGFPAELAPLTLVRLVSSSAAVGLLTEIFSTYGPDSFLGRSASVMMYCTETVFYTMSLYFLSVGITKTRHTLFCALAANFTGVALSLFLVGQLFGAG